MAIVSTGQITIVDQNDGRTITCQLGANASTQQVFTKEDATSNIYSPNYHSTALVITPRIFVSGTTTSDLGANTVQIINRKWYRGSIGGTLIWDNGTTTQDATNFVQSNGTTAVASPFTVGDNGTTLTIAGNLKDTVSTYPIFFEADYKDPITTLVTKFYAEITISVVKTGTNAVFITFRGRPVIEKSTAAAAADKSKTVIVADLNRAAGVDRGSLDYKWYDTTSGTALQISSSGTNVVTNATTRFSITDTATGAIPAVAASFGTNIPANNNANTYNSSGVGNGNTLTISELAVNNFAVLRVDITDTVEVKTYSANITINDISDPYNVIVVSESGDKLVNGQGSTKLKPEVYYGGARVNTLTGWTFTWTFRDKDGKAAGFVDNDSNAAATSYYNGGVGRPLGSNSYNVGTGVLTHQAVATAATVGAGAGQHNLVKVVKDGTARYYQITAATTTTVTLSNAPTLVTTDQFTGFPLPTTATELDGGVIYLCTVNGTRSGAEITVRAQDIEGKGTIFCAADNP